jgi:hypothetical protein
MLWSAEIATLDMWREMDRNVTNGEMQKFFKRHLQMAYEAGAREAHADRDLADRKPHEISHGLHVGVPTHCDDAIKDIISADNVGEG